MAQVGDGLERCPRCGEIKPATAEHWHFRSDGRPNGYCRPCRSADNAARYAANPPRYGPARRDYQRRYLRKRNGTPPERWRVAS
jgi:hypothetical protein